MAGSSRVHTEVQSSPGVQSFVNNIVDQYKYADITLARKLGELNLYNRNRLRLKDYADGSKRGDDPIETHARVLGFNSVVTFEESGGGGQVHVPIPRHHADDWGPRNSSRITRQLESRAPWQVHLEAPFKCSLCRKIVTLRGQEAWMIHVYADLKAYVCIHPSCKQSFKYFHLWADHVLTHHFPELKRYCVYCNGEIRSAPGLSTRNAFVEHLVYNHWNNLSDTERTAAVLNTERFLFAPFDSECGICRRSNWKTWYDFAAHVARHLEEISLAAFSDSPYPYPYPPLSNGSEMKPEKIRRHHSKKNLHSNKNKTRERDEPTKSTRTEKQVISLEERVESDGSLHDDDQDYVKIDLEAPDSPSPPPPPLQSTVKKPHRDSLRPRKTIAKTKERSRGEQSESLQVPGHGGVVGGGGKLTITGDKNEIRRKFKDNNNNNSNNKDRRRVYYPTQSPRQHQQSPNHPNEEEDIRQKTHAIDLPMPSSSSSHYFPSPYHFQHEQLQQQLQQQQPPNTGVQGYEMYGYTGAVTPQNNNYYYYMNGYPYVQGVYADYPGSGYHSPMNDDNAFLGQIHQIHQCECPTCAVGDDYV